MASNATAIFATPPTPSCKLVPQVPLLPFLSDNILATILPTIVYAIAAAFFHLLDTYNLFSYWRIHPSEDELKRNHVTRWQCLQTVIRYHVMQISIGLLLNYVGGNEPTMVGDESCRIQRAAGVISHARNLIPMTLAIVGIDAKKLGVAMKGTSAGLAQVLAGDYLSSEQNHGFTSFELSLAKLVVFICVPMFQYLIALTVVDTWIYFTHRLCHVNKTLYRIVHAQHHRLYVSYAYGAVYAHWLETLFLDILSFVLAGEIAQLSARQSMLFGSFATIKTISDHCGYVFPWDPFRLANNNGAVFHDLHHQSWGLKYNFSTYTVFWDNLLGTTWADKEGADKRYQRVWELTAKRSQSTDKEIAVTTDRSTERAVAEGKDL
ncbi:hypothetical protein OEA41_006204 [Lepraria neglecta]|uniref:Fatty acid hydroxylase domain-containing protein n=1 Tax=Lepraria neglecta TaxID=209136 RepID=A0AAD9Z7G5_9LECA|nr:hypothetical protein OEA41_006204 [Lepraria neglecta]